MKNLGKLLGIIALAMIIGFSMAGCDNPAGGDNTGDNTPPVTNPGGDDTPRNSPPGDPVAVTGVTLNKTTLNLIVGKTETLTATVAPANATNKGLTWESSNTAAATVSNGTVTAVAAGSTTITVKTTDGNKTATCTVTVYPAPDSIAITTNPTKNWCVVGDTLSDLNLTGMVVTAYYSGGSYSVPHDMLTIAGFNTATPGTNNITFTLGGKTTETFSLTVVSITSITVTPTTTIRVALNEPLNSSVLDNLTVKATYSNSVEETVTITLANINGFSSTTTGVKNLTVTYRNVTSSQFTVTVVAVSGITIVSNPTKTRYAIGEPFDPTGMTITVTYSDSSTANVTPTIANITGFNSSSATASQTVTVTYSGHTTTFVIKVYATVTFNPNGGNWSGDINNKPVETEGNAAVTMADPTNGTLTFLGWYTAAEGGTKVDLATLITTNRILYAQWAYIVTFNLNGGTLDGSTANKIVQVKENTAVANPGNPTGARRTFAGWYTEANGGTEYNFATIITASRTLYARWNFTLPLTDVTDVAPYLNTLPANTVDTPVSLPLQINLGIMTTAGSGWQQLLTALNTAGKFVNLDLSACTMTGTEFNPDSTVSAGKDKIVTIALPNTAISIADGSDWNGSNYVVTFNYFTVLKSFSGTELKIIGRYAFIGLTSLTQTTLPAGITTIGRLAFGSCTNLALTSLPTGVTVIEPSAFVRCANLALNSLPEGLTTLGDEAFSRCTKLALNSLPPGITEIGTSTFVECSGLTQFTLHAGITSIGNYAFIGCTNLRLTILATTPPTLGGDNVFTTFANNSDILPNLRIEVPAASVSAYKAATRWNVPALSAKIFAITP